MNTVRFRECGPGAFIDTASLYIFRALVFNRPQVKNIKGLTYPRLSFWHPLLWILLIKRPRAEMAVMEKELCSVDNSGLGAGFFYIPYHLVFLLPPLPFLLPSSSSPSSPSSSSSSWPSLVPHPLSLQVISYHLHNLSILHPLQLLLQFPLLLLPIQLPLQSLWIRINLLHALL